MFLNIIELAQSLGVEESEVAGWIRKDGLPYVTDRGRLLFDRDTSCRLGGIARSGCQSRLSCAGTLKNPKCEKKLETMLRTGGIWRDVPAASVFNLFADIVAKLPGATPPVRQMLQQRLRAPDGISWALVGGGLAHCRTCARPSRLAATPEFSPSCCCAIRSPFNEPAPDEQPITRLLFFVAPSPRAHLEILAQLSTALARGDLRGS
jgi:PTS system nitrogen regulatory IIA component